MPRAHTLPDETDDERGSFVPVDQGEIYVGDQVRVREVVKRTGAGGEGAPTTAKRVNGIMRSVRWRGVRTTIADVHRVAAGRDGCIYITGLIVSSECEGEDPPGNLRFRHKIGSRKAGEEDQKELLRHVGFGPDATVRAAQTPVEHSHSVRMASWRDLVGQAVSAGIPSDVLTQALIDQGDHVARMHAGRRSSEMVARGKPPIPLPADIGEAEYKESLLAMKFEAEPAYWMWTVVSNAVADPATFAAERDWRAAS